MVKRYGVGTMVAIAVTVLIWSTTFAGLVAALRTFSPQHLLFLRWTLTAVLFAGLALAMRMRLPERRDLPKFALAGVLGIAAYQLLLVMGQSGISASMAGFLVNLNPVFTTLIAVALGRDKASPLTWTGLAGCMAGLWLMAQGNGGLGQIGWSAALVVLAALSFSLYTLVTKPLLARYHPLEVTAYSTIAGAIPFAVYAPGSLAALQTAPSSALLTVAFLAIFPGGIAYVLWSRSVSSLPPGLASRFLYLIPVIGVPVAWAWVGEAPSALTVAGGIVTIAGVAVASFKGLPTWARLRPVAPAVAADVPPARPAAEAA